MRLHPFRPLRPRPELAARVAAPPYDVVSRAEAGKLAAGNPLSFIRVGRAEVGLPDDVDPHDARVYERARDALETLRADGVLVEEADRSLYLYRQVMEGRAQLGVVGCVDVEDYERGVIRKHETTRPDKEEDRTRHVLTLNAHAEPVFLTYRGQPEIDRLAADSRGPALYDFVTADGVRHTVWRVPDPAPYVEAFARVERAYVADGHHRSAAAWRAGRLRRAENPRHRGDEEYNRFTAALFPAAEVKILPYNRLVTDLGGRTAGAILDGLRSTGRLAPTGDPRPPAPGSFCVYLERRWHLLTLAEGSIDHRDPVGSLDVALLQERVLGPLLGIADQRTDRRIDFVGGARGVQELVARVDGGEAALAVSLFPTTVEQLMAVADSGQVMPPKSTWFEPKLLSGLWIHPLD